MPAISVILSTYNQPAWLEHVLRGYARQTFRDFELVVADDGSTDETRARIDALRPQLPFPLLHEWHPDDGFRKCVILNRAVRRCSADYLVFSDGDCIPREDFLATHLRLRAPGRFLSGGYVKLSRAASEAITADDIAAGRFAEPAWLRANGMRKRRALGKLSAPAWLAPLLDAATTARPTWNGHNASGWKHDLLEANGFDERMQYGGEDAEFGYRLRNAGIRGKRIRYRAIVVHLDHDRGYVTPEMRARNHAIKAVTKRGGVLRTEYGIERATETSATTVD